MAQHANSVHEGSGAATQLGEDEVRAQLDRIRSSPDFEVPDRARKFLSCIVEEALTGRASRIKAYSIATEVFGRDASFDAQNDPVVRIEASRIRRALERYYLTAGRNDPLGIEMPKGAYVPIFARRIRAGNRLEQSRRSDSKERPVAGLERAQHSRTPIACELVFISGNLRGRSPKPRVAYEAYGNKGTTFLWRPGQPVGLDRMSE